MHSRQYPIITEMADIDMYECFKGFDSVPLNSLELPEMAVFSVKDLIKAIKEGQKPIPFGKEDAELKPSWVDNRSR